MTMFVVINAKHSAAAGADNLSSAAPSSDKSAPRESHNPMHVKTNILIIQRNKRLERRGEFFGSESTQAGYLECDATQPLRNAPLFDKVQLPMADVSR